MPRQQALLKRPDLAKVINLHVDPESYWIYTNTPLDNDAASRAAAVGATCAAPSTRLVGPARKEMP